ncbi:MAG: polysaccharide biosynthesis tyrosine autokinase [Candidatus Scalindua sp.]|nr:polysaccharide biosynthesis tyrosine autokinase [Candidatus Scalindua sp.]
MLQDNEIHEQEIHLRDYWQIVLRRKWIIIASFVIVLTLVTFQTFKATPIYKVTTQVKIDKENPNILSFEEVISINNQGNSFYQTQYKILASRSLALRVIKSLKLEDNPEFKSDGKSKGFSIKSFISSLIKRESESADSGINRDDDDDDKYSSLISRYLGRLSITPIKGSSLVNISFTGVHLKEIKKIVNMHANEYIDSNLEVRFAASNDAVQWLQKQILSKKELVEKAENSLQIYKEKKKIVSLEDRQNIIVQKLEDLNSRLTDARTVRMKLEILDNLIKKYVGDQDMLETIPGIMESEMISDFKKEHVGLLTEIKRLSKRYGRNHPSMIEAVTKADELKAKIDEEVVKLSGNIEAEYRVAVSEEESLSVALEEQKVVALQLNRDAIAYGTLKREGEGERAMYEILLKRLKETNITGELQTSNIRIVDRAETPRAPIKPRKRRNVLLGAVLGLFVGIGLSFFLEYLDNTIKSPDDVEQYLGIPLLGVIERSNDIKSSELIVHESPKSVISEALRNVRTGVLFSLIDKPNKLIMVTSAVQGEGKSTMASNLACAIAQTGKKTLLVDTDLRKPRLNDVFTVPRKPGLSDFFLGVGNLESITRKTSVPNLSLITSGTIPYNPSEILESTHMEKFCETVRDKYDIVIFDTPPAMTVTDAVVMTKNMDGVILSIKSGSTVKHTAKRCIAQLTSSKCEMLGAIINYVDNVKGGYYYHYYAHYYKYGYSSEEEMLDAEKT